MTNRIFKRSASPTPTKESRARLLEQQARQLERELGVVHKSEPADVLKPIAELEELSEIWLKINPPDSYSAIPVESSKIDLKQVDFTVIPSTEPPVRDSRRAAGSCHMPTHPSSDPLSDSYIQTDEENEDEVPEDSRVCLEYILEILVRNFITSYVGESAVELFKEFFDTILYDFRQFHRRKRNLSYDLVGVELEPGPGPKGKSTVKIVEIKEKKKKNKKENLSTALVPYKSKPAALQKLSGSTFNPRADMSMYAMTLMNPEASPPVRLGGNSTIQTALTQLHMIYSYAVTNANTSVIVHPRAWQPLLVSVSTTAPYSYVVPSGSPGFLASAVTTLQTIGDAARVVSSKLKVYTLASATTDNGMINMGLCPRDDGFLANTYLVQNAVAGASGYNAVSEGGFPIGITSVSANVIPNCTQGFNEFDDYDFTCAHPLKDGAAAFYECQDPQSLIFVPDRLREQFINTTGSGASSTPVQNASPIVDPFFVVGLQGVSTGTVVVFEMFLNLEYTVSSGASGIISTQCGSMSDDQIFHVNKRVFGDANNTVVPDPEMSFGEHLGKIAKTVARGGIAGVSKFLFGSSDVGNMVSDLIGI